MASKASGSTSKSGIEESKASESTSISDWGEYWEKLDLGALTEAQIDALWRGLDTLQGSGDGYRQAAEWWNKVSKKFAPHVAKACIVMLDKPPRLIAAGEVRSKGSKNLTAAQLADDRLARFLPVIEGGYVVEDGGKDTRVNWRGFRNVNLTKARRVAKMLIASRSIQYPAVAKWIEKYGGEFGRIDKTSRGYVKVCADPVSKAIFDAHDADVLAWKRTWEPVFKSDKPEATK